jgi:hypothetical protein
MDKPDTIPSFKLLNALKMPDAKATSTAAVNLSKLKATRPYVAKSRRTTGLRPRA